MSQPVEPEITAEDRIAALESHVAHQDERINLLTKALNGARFQRVKDVAARVAVTERTIYRMVDRGEFPAPISLGERAVVWEFDAVEAWMRARIEGAH